MGPGGLGSLLKTNKTKQTTIALKLHLLYRVEQRQGFLHTVEQGGGGYGLQLEKEAGLANFEGSSLQAINIQG